MGKQVKRRQFRPKRGDWIGNLTDDEAEEFLDFIASVTPQGDELAQQREWVINMLILSPTVVNYGAVRQDKSTRVLMTIHDINERQIYERLDSLWRMARHRLHPAA